MLNQCITVLAMAVVTGPDGRKLKPGKTYEYEDSARLRILVKSGNVTLIDPASLDEDYLERAGYVEKKPEKKNASPPPNKSDDGPKEPVSLGQPIPEEDPQEKGASDHEPDQLQLTTPVGMGVKKSEDPNN